MVFFLYFFSLTHLPLHHSISSIYEMFASATTTSEDVVGGKRGRYVLVTPPEDSAARRQLQHTSPHDVLEEESVLFQTAAFEEYGKLVSSVAGPAEASTGPSPSILPSIESLNQRYRRLVKIGEGTFGEVFIVYDTVADTYLTMKRVFRVLHPQGRTLFGVHNTTFRELQLLTTLSHCNVLGLVDYHFLMDGSLLLLLPLVAHDCVSLMRHWPRPSDSHQPSQCSGRMPLPVVKCIFAQVLDGVAYLHKRKVIHRDLKPSNVMIDYDGTVKLIDFGWSRFITSEPNGRMTGPPCSVHYRPPELLLHRSARYDFSVDVWCCGCVLFELLTAGTLLVPGRTEREALDCIIDWLGSPTPDSRVYGDSVTRNSEEGKPFIRPGRPNTFAVRCSTYAIAPSEVQFLQTMLQLEPARRARAEDLRRSEWFHSAPAACAPWELQLPQHNQYRWLEAKRRRRQPA